jgi:tRNA uridine 5-carboxymethylaminomethyl modification enzyme
LLFNHGSAELRLVEHARRYKLLDEKRLALIDAKRTTVAQWTHWFENHRTSGSTMAERIRRGEREVSLPAAFLAEASAVRQEVLYRIRYQGYLQREERQIEKLQHAERIRIPASFDYLAIRGLRRESALKLTDFKPFTLGQASRISGVNPSDIGILMVAIAAGRGGESRNVDNS